MTAGTGNRIILALCVIGAASSLANGSVFWGVICGVGVIHTLIIEVQGAAKR